MENQVSDISPLQWLPQDEFWCEPRINAALSVLYAEPPNTWLDKKMVAALAINKYDLGDGFPWQEFIDLNFDEYRPAKVIKALSKLSNEYNDDEHELEVIEVIVDDTKKHFFPSIGKDTITLDADEELVASLKNRINRGTARLDGFTFEHLVKREDADAEEVYRALIHLLCEGDIYRHLHDAGDSGYTYEYWVDDETVDQETDALSW